MLMSSPDKHARSRLAVSRNASLDEGIFERMCSTGGGSLVSVLLLRKRDADAATSRAVSRSPSCLGECTSGGGTLTDAFTQASVSDPLQRKRDADVVTSRNLTRALLVINGATNQLNMLARCSQQAVRCARQVVVRKGIRRVWWELLQDAE